MIQEFSCLYTIQILSYLNNHLVYDLWAAKVHAQYDFNEILCNMPVQHGNISTQATQDKTTQPHSIAPTSVQQALPSWLEYRYLSGISKFENWQFNKLLFTIHNFS